MAGGINAPGRPPPLALAMASSLVYTEGMLSNITQMTPDPPTALSEAERNEACAMFNDDMADPTILDAGLNVLPLGSGTPHLCGHAAFNGPGIDRTMGFGCNGPAAWHIDVHAGACYACDEHLHLALRYSVRSFLEA